MRAMMSETRASTACSVRYARHESACDARLPAELHAEIAALVIVVSGIRPSSGSAWYRLSALPESPLFVNCPMSLVSAGRPGRKRAPKRCMTSAVSASEPPAAPSSNLNLHVLSPM